MIFRFTLPAVFESLCKRGRQMLDGIMRARLDPMLNAWGRRLAGRGFGADQITLFGLALGLVAAGLIAMGAHMGLALIPLLAGRVADGLDGAVARARQKTDFGGYLDIVCDFIFYGAIPLAFAIRDPAFALPAAFLLTSFYANGASFLAFAVFAEKNDLKTSARGEKSLYFTAGLLEGTETIAFFIVICLWPSAFPALAYGFGILCFVTATARVILAKKSFGA
jgi:phosphatidylglycerophosphate synthase